MIQAMRPVDSDDQWSGPRTSVAGLTPFEARRAAGLYAFVQLTHAWDANLSAKARGFTNHDCGRFCREVEAAAEVAVAEGTELPGLDIMWTQFLATGKPVA